jgi:hypothetical protein
MDAIHPGVVPMHRVRRCLRVFRKPCATLGAECAADAQPVRHGR